MDFSVFLLDDTVAEGNESFTVILESSDPGVVISSGTVEIIIIDNDGKKFNGDPRTHTLESVFPGNDELYRFPAIIIYSCGNYRLLTWGYK